ncbi:MAG: DUF1810 family protein [Prevotellaceae bacterium]|jgi:uncharacterized protein (DUF1810 family)|nr:DUF1810 family protein [Prevotellaceae bacterium]
MKILPFRHTTGYCPVKTVDEAINYLNYSVFGSRLIEIPRALLQLESLDADKIMWYSDDFKLQSSITLLSRIENAAPVLKTLINRYFHLQTNKNMLERTKKTDKNKKHL